MEWQALDYELDDELTDGGSDEHWNAASLLHNNIYHLPVHVLSHKTLRLHNAARDTVYITRRTWLPQQFMAFGARTINAAFTRILQ